MSRTEGKKGLYLELDAIEHRIIKETAARQGKSVKALIMSALDHYYGISDQVLLETMEWNDPDREHVLKRLLKRGSSEG